MSCSVCDSAEGGGTNPQTVVSQEGVEFHMTGNPFDLYDVPRSTLEDDTIYDYPLDFDLGDMEIYDYPPDAAQLGTSYMYEYTYSTLATQLHVGTTNMYMYIQCHLL